MKSKIFNLLLPVLLLSIYYAATPAVAQAQAEPPPPPPPPRKDYFPNTWDEYTFKTRNFRIRFPEEPRESVEPHERYDIHTFEYKGLLLYRVLYVDYKKAIDDPERIKGFLRSFRTGVVEPLKKEGLSVVSEREVTVDGYNGIFIHLEVRGKEVIRIQWVVAGSRLYTISVLSRKGSPQELEGKDDFEKVAMGFINSFHIVP